MRSRRGSCRRTNWPRRQRSKFPGIGATRQSNLEVDMRRNLPPLQMRSPGMFADPQSVADQIELIDKVRYGRAAMDLSEPRFYSQCHRAGKWLMATVGESPE